MGDLLKITTSIRMQKIFYKVTSNAISFEVKGSGSAIVGLAKRPSRQPTYLVVLGVDNRSWIQKFSGRGKSKAADTPDLLDVQEYRRFWLTWHGSYICFGRGGEYYTTMRYACDVEDLNYVTFGTTNRHAPVQWKVELAPMLDEPKLKPIKGGTLGWATTNTDDGLPVDALIGGYENEILYIIRAPHRGSLTPGKFVPSRGLGYVSWGGQANEKIEYEVLCGYNCKWVTTVDDKIPVGAIEAGYSETIREPLYIGRVFHEGHLIPGKVQVSHKCCYIAFDGREVGYKKYEILVHTCNGHSVSHPTMFSFDINIENEEESEPEEYEGEDFIMAF